MDVSSSTGMQPHASNFMIAGVHVRQGRASDVDAVASLLVRTWRTNYRGLVSDGFLDHLSSDEQATRQLRLMSRPGACHRVAVEGSTVLGFACGGPARDPADRWRHELYALYVAPRLQGHGIGRRLLEALWRDLGVQAAEEMGVWVLAGNDDARAFYERVGGRPRAAGWLDLGDRRYPQVSYVLDPPGGGARIAS
ncbi:MAG: GNAT family N-acetyltransferase [Rhodocyclaceae bacterium]|nr:MAG: GNAT family N-acetyltransferase [Rhodocyclaceae bacterium]